MLDTPIVWRLAVRLPGLFTGRALHRAALHAIVAGAYPVAEALLERAAAHYRIDLEVEALARLRVHQLIARSRAAGVPHRDEALSLEIEQRLTRMEWIEPLNAPFDLVPARLLLATWTLEPRTPSPDRIAPAGPGHRLPDAA